MGWMLFLPPNDQAANYQLCAIKTTVGAQCYLQEWASAAYTAERAA